MDSWISTVFPWPPSLISPCWIFKEQISLSFWSDVMTVRSDKPVRRDTLLLDSSMDHRKMMNSHCTSRSLEFSKKEPALIDRRSFSNVLYIPTTTRLFIVSTSVVSVLVITSSVLVQLSLLKIKKEKAPQSKQQPDNKPSYQKLKKNHKRVSQSFQNQRRQNPKLKLEEHEKDTEEFASLMRTTSEAVKTLQTELADAKRTQGRGSYSALMHS
ncbi:hypothetical protein pdam_00023954 [Pocillopora damicornis]|uniref:Uncharacterized protein n=1 Tax=Pocillopora damicornis TaxID=46731 RepID=A0A3M6U795_POCDA|nr:hypothetical protein pdam_00023954 [Pocillopora damicornis]